MLSCRGGSELENEYRGPSEPYMEMISELLSRSEVRCLHPAALDNLPSVALESDLKMEAESRPDLDLA